MVYNMTNQGKFNKECLETVRESFEYIIKQLSKAKIMDCIGEMNEVYLFLDACQKKMKEDK